MLIEENFGGTYMGGLSQMRFYNKPLDASELMHNYQVNTERYGLIDCDCIDTVSLSFGDRAVRWDTYTSENVTSWVGTSNNHPLPRRYSSNEPYCCTSIDAVCNGDNYLNCQTQADCTSTSFHKCGGVWHGIGGTLVPDIPKFPFTSVPEKPMTITIIRPVVATAKITFTGKRVR